MNFITQLIVDFNQESGLRKCEHALVLFFGLVIIRHLSKSHGGFRKNFLKNFVRLFTQNKLMQKKLGKVLEKEAQKTIDTLMQGKSQPKNKELPDVGINHNSLLEIMKENKKEDLNPYEGKSFAYVYQYSKEHTEFTGKAFDMFMHTNVLNPMKYVSVRNMEVEVVAMTAKMFNGNEKFVGNVTSGGSESILLAIKAYRDYYKASHPNIDYQPEVILCETAHPAFMKAAQLFNVKLVLAKYDKNWKMDIEHTKSLINTKTALIVCSAPQYPHGIVDPIEQISEIGFQKNIPVHVDGAIGGFVLPWLEKLGQDIPKFDFRCRGVASMNADVHKFGFAPKGSSVLVFREPSVRIHYFSTYSEWCGGMYISPTLLGTRNGGCISSAWASLMAIGKSGFMDVTKKMLLAADAIKEAVNSIPELEIVGDPKGNILAFKSSGVSNINIYHLADALEEIGYHMERQKQPDCLHCTVMMQHYVHKDQLIKDIKKCVQIVKEDPKRYSGSDGSAAMYGMLGSIPDGAIVDDFLKRFLDRIYAF